MAFDGTSMQRGFRAMRQFHSALTCILGAPSLGALATAPSLTKDPPRRLLTCAIGLAPPAPVRWGGSSMSFAFSRSKQGAAGSPSPSKDGGGSPPKKRNSVFGLLGGTSKRESPVTSQPELASEVTDTDTEDSPTDVYTRAINVNAAVEPLRPPLQAPSPVALPASPSPRVQHESESAPRARATVKARPARSSDFGCSSLAAAIGAAAGCLHTLRPGLADQLGLSSWMTEELGEIFMLSLIHI